MLSECLEGNEEGQRGKDMSRLTQCSSCKTRERCVARAVTEREAIFAWSDGASFGCEDYQADLYHGLEGVVDVASLDSIYHRGGFGCSGRGYRAGSMACQGAAQ